MTQTCNQANTSETRRRLSATFPIFLKDCDDDDDGGERLKRKRGLLTCACFIVAFIPYPTSIGAVNTFPPARPPASLT